MVNSRSVQWSFKQWRNRFHDGRPSFLNHSFFFPWIFYGRFSVVPSWLGWSADVSCDLCVCYNSMWPSSSPVPVRWADDDIWRNVYNGSFQRHWLFDLILLSLTVVVAGLFSVFHVVVSFLYSFTFGLVFFFTGCFFFFACRFYSAFISLQALLYLFWLRYSICIQASLIWIYALLWCVSV